MQKLTEKQRDQVFSQVYTAVCAVVFPQGLMADALKDPVRLKELNRITEIARYAASRFEVHKDVQPENVQPAPIGRVVTTKDDKLVQRRWNSVTKKETFHGKRVSKECPLTKEEIRAYVEHGTVPCIRLMRDIHSDLSLTELLRLLNKARYGTDDRTKIDELVQKGCFK